MKKENYSYVYAPKTLQGALQNLTEAISRTENYFAGHNGMDEYKKCLERGTTYKRDEVLADCRAWLKESHAPHYMHQTALENAYNSLGEELNAWIDGLPKFVPICFNVNGEGRTVDVSDIIVTQDGWKPSERLIKELTDRYTKTLSDEEMADIALAEQLADLYSALQAKGYDIEPATFSRHKTPGQRAELFCNSYNALNDCRVSNEEKERMKRERQSYLNCII